MGHYLRTSKGNNYLSVFMDTFTEWVELVPVRVINGTILTREINETIFLRYGDCDEFISDNGFEFDNKDVTKFLDEYGLSHTFIPPRHAIANPVDKNKSGYQDLNFRFY